MKELTKKAIKEFQENYQQNPVQKVLRKALVKNPIKDIATVFEAQQNVNYKFSIDLDTLSPNNQRSTG